MILRIRHWSATTALAALLLFTGSWLAGTVHVLLLHHDHVHEVPDCDPLCDNATPHLHHTKIKHDDHCPLCTIWHASPVLLPDVQLTRVAAEYRLKTCLLYQTPGARMAGGATASRGPPAAQCSFGC